MLTQRFSRLFAMGCRSWRSRLFRPSTCPESEIRLFWERNTQGMNIPPFFQHHMQNGAKEDCLMGSIFIDITLNRIVEI